MSSRNVEENVVKMRFDNQDFDQNIEESNNTVRSFKDTLLSLPQNIQIGLSSILSNINLSDILGIGATLAGITLVKKGIVGIGEAVQSVANSALRTVNNVFNQAINQINAGGKARAANIANAKFQIEGLKLDVDTFMEAADYAVSGTAYGLDSAAKVASQLGASGVTQLEELKTALRSVSGVAAMTNSSYDEIGNIYTTIASNGRLMTENIRSFSARGLNVMANLAKALGKTEADISEMVRKGQIDFKTFYTAMDEAFGEHAKDANKTFEGAMSNVRAALSRIGEGIWSPIMDNAINVFNELRLTINALKAELVDNSVYVEFGNAIKNIFDNAAKMIKLVRYALDETSAVEQFANMMKSAFKIVDDFFDAFAIDYGFVMNEIITNLSAIFFAINQVIIGIRFAINEAFGIRKLGGEFNSLLVWVSSLFRLLENVRASDISPVLSSWLKALKSVFEVVTDILGIKKKNLSEVFSGAVETIGYLFERLKLSDDQIDKITRTFRGLASILDVVKMLVVSVFNFIKPIFGFIPNIADALLTVTSTIGDFLYNLRNVIKESEVFDKIFDKIKEGALFLKGLFENIGTNFFDAFFGVESQDKTFLDKLVDFIKKIGETVSSAFGDIDFSNIDITPITEFIKNLANFGLDSGQVDEAGNSISWISVVLNKAKELLDKVGEFFNTHVLSLFSNEDGKFDSLNSFIDSLKDGISKFMSSVSDFLSQGNGLSDVTIIASIYLIYKILELVKEVALAFFEFATNMASIITGNFNTANAGFMDVMVSFLDKMQPAGFFSKIHTFLTDIKDINFTEIIHGYEEKDTWTSALMAVSEIFKAFGLAMLEIAAALFIIALIPEDRLQSGIDILTRMTTTIGLIAIAAIAITNLSAFKLANVNVKGLTLGAINNTMGTASPIGSISKIIKAFGLMFIEISAALFIITQLCDPTKTERAVDILEEMILILSSIVAALIFGLSKINVEATDVSAMGIAIAAIGATVVLMAAAIAIIASSIGPGDAAKVWTAFGVIALLLAEIGGIFALITGFAQSNPWSIVATGAAMLATMIGFMGVISVVTASLLTLSFIPEDKLTKAATVVGIMIAVIGVISLLVIAIGGAIGSAGPEAILGMTIAVAAILSLASAFLSLAPLVVSVAVVVASLALLVKTFKDFVQYLGEMDEDKASKIVENVVRILNGVADAIVISFVRLTADLLLALGRLLPAITKFVVTQLIPFENNLFNLLVPDFIKNILNSIALLSAAILNALPSFLNVLDEIFFGSDSILLYIYETLDQIWDDTVAWMLERIPVVVPDIFAIVLTLLRVINDALAENWVDLDVELQKLIDQTLLLLSDLFTGQKTWDDIDEMLGKLFDHISEVVADNQDEIREAFEAIGEVMGNGLMAGILNAIPDGKIKDWLTEQMDLNDVSGGLTSGRDWGVSDSLSGINSSGIELSSLTRVPTDLSKVNITGGVRNAFMPNWQNPSESSNKDNKVNVHSETTVNFEGSIGRVFNSFTTENRTRAKGGWATE